MYGRVTGSFGHLPCQHNSLLAVKQKLVNDLQNYFSLRQKRETYYSDVCFLQAEFVEHFSIPKSSPLHRLFPNLFVPIVLSTLMAMLTEEICQRKSNHSPYISKLYIWKIYIFTSTFGQTCFNCPSSSERPTETDSRLHWFKYAFQDSESENHILQHF